MNSSENNSKLEEIRRQLNDLELQKRNLLRNFIEEVQKQYPFVYRIQKNTEGRSYEYGCFSSKAKAQAMIPVSNHYYKVSVAESVELQDDIVLAIDTQPKNLSDYYD